MQASDTCYCTIQMTMYRKNELLAQAHSLLISIPNNYDTTPRVRVQIQCVLILGMSAKEVWDIAIQQQYEKLFYVQKL